MDGWINSHIHVLDLPLEILIKVFQCLSIDDLKIVIQVNRYFRIAGEDPSLWKSLVIPEVHPDDLKEFLSLPRLSWIQSLHISDWLSVDHFKLMESKSSLKYLNISRCLLQETDQFEDNTIDLCSKVMNSMEVLNINRAYLTINQYQQLFEDMAKSTKIKKLIVNTPEFYEDEDPMPILYRVKSENLARALSRLVTVQISDCCLTAEQIRVITKEIGRDNCCLEELGIAYNDFSDVDGNDYKSLVKLKKLDLSGTNIFHSDNSNAFLKQILISSHISYLDLGFNSFSGTNNNRSRVDPKLLAKALNKIEYLGLIGVDFTNVQASEFFKRMCVKTCLKELYFEDCKYDMSLVNPNFKAAGLNRLTKLRMGNSSINGPQLLEVFERMAKFTNIQYVDFSFLDLCGVPPTVFSDALNKIQKVILLDCCVSSDQLVTLFRTVLVSTNISFLDLSLVPLASFSIEDLVEGALMIETLRLFDTGIPTEVVEEILCRVNPEKKLKLLELSIEDACDISDVILYESHLEELRIWDDYKLDEDSFTVF